MDPPAKPCERCPAEAEPGQRFCTACEAAMLCEMEQAGYLTPEPERRRGRRWRKRLRDDGTEE